MHPKPQVHLRSVRRRTNPIARITTHEDAPNEPLAKMMSVEMQKTNSIANITLMKMRQTNPPARLASMRNPIRVHVRNNNHFPTNQTSSTSPSHPLLYTIRSV